MAFRDILKDRRSSGEGIISSIASAAYGSTRESLDFRNTFFKSGTLLNALFPKFKGYKAIDRKTTKPSPINKLSAVESTISLEKLDEINRNTSIFAKNSIVLPKMAMDMNLMKLNLMKLVKAQGQTIIKKPDMFFARAKEREDIYEKQFGRKTTPTRVGETDGNKSSAFTGLLSSMSLVGGAFGKLTSIIGTIFKPLTSLSNIIVGVLSALSNFSRGIFKILVFLGKSKIGKLLGLGTIAFGISKMGSAEETPEIPDVVEPTEENSASGLSGLEKTIIGGGAAIAAYSGVKGAISAGKAISGTRTAIMDARTMSVSQLAKSSPKTTWGKFLVFVAKKSPELWGRIGLKLAQAGALATIPFAGWILAAIQLGFSLWTAWEVYELWREFNNTPEESDTSPTPSSPEVDDLLGAIGKAEGGSMGYDAINRGKAGDTPGGMPGLSKMSVGEVMKMQDDKKVFAAGKYQIIPSTLKGLVDSGVVSKEDKFDAATQDKLANELIQRRLVKAGNDPIKQQYELSKEFASIANPYTGVSYYADRGNNKATIASLSNRGSLLNNTSMALADSRMSLRSSQPVVINAPTNNVQQPNSTGMSGGLPSVVDQDFMKYLVARVT